MITEKELSELHWYSRGDMNAWCFMKGDWFYILRFPAGNSTRHFFEMQTNAHIIYLGNIPDKQAMICLMRWLEFPQYDKAGDPWNTLTTENNS